MSKKKLCLLIELLSLFFSIVVCQKEEEWNAYVNVAVKLKKKERTARPRTPDSMV